MLTIGPHRITTPLLLAPMAGVSDSAFREICSAQGAGLTVAEMLTSNSDNWDSDKNRLRLVPANTAGPRVVQIAGADPDMMAQAARLNVASGADVIDINMGCPAKKVLQKAAGSALLKDLRQVESILQAVVNAVDVPVTLKIRTGWCPASRNGVQVARLAEQLGIRMLTVHGRTRQCRFLGQAEYDTIAAIKQAVLIPVIANGDITDPVKAREVLRQTGADGLMIGRAAQGRPWIFREISRFLADGDTEPSPSLMDVHRIICSHLGKIYSLYGDYKGVLFARKHFGWYVKTLADYAPPDFDPTPLRLRFNQCQVPALQLDVLHDYFSALEFHNKELAA